MKRLLIAAAGVAMMTSGAMAQTTAQQDVTINASVPKFCKIGTPGVATPAAIVQNLTIDALGIVNTTPIVLTVNNVTCNTAANVTATSQSGGVTSATAAASGFTNIIDYTGSAAYSSVTSTINTVTNPAATGAEAGNVATTSGAGSGAMTITITPAQPSSPLMAATDYTDTLRITLAPQ